MRYLKFALFSFICSIVFALAAEILNVAPIFILTVLCILACVGSLLIWLCTTIFHRFKYSLNVILIIIFLTLAVVAYFFQPESIHVENLGDFANLNYIALIGIASALACCISILTLIGQLIFGRRSKELLYDESEDERCEGESQAGLPQDRR